MGYFPHLNWGFWWFGFRRSVSCCSRIFFLIDRSVVVLLIVVVVIIVVVNGSAFALWTTETSTLRTAWWRYLTAWLINETGSYHDNLRRRRRCGRCRRFFVKRFVPSRWRSHQKSKREIEVVNKNMSKCHINNRPVVEQRRIVAIHFIGELTIENLLVEGGEVCAHEVVALAEQTLMINLWSSSMERVWFCLKWRATCCELLDIYGRRLRKSHRGDCRIRNSSRHDRAFYSKMDNCWDCSRLEQAEDSDPKCSRSAGCPLMAAEWILLQRWPEHLRQHQISPLRVSPLGTRPSTPDLKLFFFLKENGEGEKKWGYTFLFCCCLTETVGRDWPQFGFVSPFAKVFH